MLRRGLGRTADSKSAAPLELHVVGLDVTMDDAVRVGISERIHDVAQNPHGLSNRKLMVGARVERAETCGMT